MSVYNGSTKQKLAINADYYELLCTQRFIHFKIFCTLCFTIFDVINEPRHEKKLSYVICNQQRRRSACASAQSDQRLYCSLLG